LKGYEGLFNKFVRYWLKYTYVSNALGLKGRVVRGGAGGGGHHHLGHSQELCLRHRRRHHLLEVNPAFVQQLNRVARKDAFAYVELAEVELSNAGALRAVGREVPVLVGESET